MVKEYSYVDSKPKVGRYGKVVTREEGQSPGRELPGSRRRPPSQSKDRRGLEVRASLAGAGASSPHYHVIQNLLGFGENHFFEFDFSIFGKIAVISSQLPEPAAGCDRGVLPRP